MTSALVPWPALAGRGTPTLCKTGHLNMNQQSLLLGGLIPRAQKSDGRANLPLTFRTIFANPPGDVLQRGGRGAHRHYALMTVEEIAALPVGRLANADAHL